MPSWRCPHCSTPQSEASRCWVCHRSSTSCGTCRHFRGSVAKGVGFCGVDRRHGPLNGDEVRACWQDGALVVAPDPVTPGLLDLLTLARLDVGSTGSTDGPGDPLDERPMAAPRRATFRPRATQDDAGDRRLWVEVEV